MKSKSKGKLIDFWALRANFIFVLAFLVLMVAGIFVYIQYQNNKSSALDVSTESLDCQTYRQWYPEESRQELPCPASIDLAVATADTTDTTMTGTVTDFPIDGAYPAAPLRYAAPYYPFPTFIPTIPPRTTVPSTYQPAPSSTATLTAVPTSSIWPTALPTSNQTAAPQPTISPTSNPQYVAKVGVRKQGYKYDTKTPPNLVYLYSAYHEAIIQNVTVRFYCQATRKQIEKKTNGSGNAWVTQSEADALGCNLFDIGADLSRYNSPDGLPNQSEETYDYYFSVTGVNKVTVVPLYSDPYTRFVGIRPSLQGKLTDRNGNIVTGQDVCFLYTKTSSSTWASCTKKGEGTYVTSNEKGYYLFYTVSWGDWMRARNLGDYGWGDWMRRRNPGDHKGYIELKKADGTFYPEGLIQENPLALVGYAGVANTHNASMTCLAPGSTIAAEAVKYDGQSNKIFVCYTGAPPELACASFVSYVLVKAHVLPSKCYTASAADLERIVVGNGAATVKKHVAITTVNEDGLVPGDIIFFYGGDNVTHHTGIYVGNGMIVDTSSSDKNVQNRALTIHAGKYQYFSAYRFGCK